MKLWYQSLGRLDLVPGYMKILEGIVTDAADPDTTIEVHGLKKSAGIGDHYRFLEFRDAQEVVANGVAAGNQGFDAFLVGNIGDPGLHELRECLNVPVLGLCQTTLHLACLMGASFSLVTINDKFTPRIIENVERYGLKGRMVSAERMKFDRIPEIERAIQEPEINQRMRDQFAEAAEAAVKKGAEVIIPAVGGVMAFLAHENIGRVERAPVLNGIVALIKMGEMAVKLKRQTGEFTSRQMTYAPPPPNMLEELRKHYGADIYPGMS